MKTRLWILLLAIGFAFSACDKDDEMKVNHDRGKGRQIATSEGTCIFEGTTDLIAGQNTPVGTVNVEFTDNDIVVTFNTDKGWFITETHLHIAADFGGFPTGGGGNPQIGRFDFGDDDLDTDIVKYTIPKDKIDPAPQSDEDGKTYYYIAAHAVVVGEVEGGVVNLDAFNAKFPVGPVTVIQGKGPSKNNSAYFENIEISGEPETFLDGLYEEGWCVQTRITTITPGEATAYSSYGYLPEGIVDKPDNFNQVNWILNNISAGMDAGGDLGEYTMADIQMAIWELIANEEPQYPGLLGPYSDERIAKLGELAEEDFIPGCGEKIVIVLDYGPEAQNIIITVPLPCFQEETAWGSGSLFTQRGSWAMYFQVCE